MLFEFEIHHLARLMKVDCIFARVSFSKFSIEYHGRKLTMHAMVGSFHHSSPDIPQFHEHARRNNALFSLLNSFRSEQARTCVTCIL